MPSQPPVSADHVRSPPAAPAAAAASLATTSAFHASGVRSMRGKKGYVRHCTGRAS